MAGRYLGQKIHGASASNLAGFSTQGLGPKLRAAPANFGGPRSVLGKSGETWRLCPFNDDLNQCITVLLNITSIGIPLCAATKRFRRLQFTTSPTHTTPIQVLIKPSYCPM